MNIKQKRVMGIILLVLLLLLLVKCASGRSRKISDAGDSVEEIVRDDSEKILDQMKKDQERLRGLFLRGDVCSEEWSDDLMEVILRIQNYSYSGSELEILSLVEQFKQYGERLEEVVVLIQEGKFEESIEKLEEEIDRVEEIEEGIADAIKKVD